MLYYYYFFEYSKYFAEENRLVWEKRLRKLQLSDASHFMDEDQIILDGLVFSNLFNNFPNSESNSESNIFNLKSRTIRVYLDFWIRILFDAYKILDRNHVLIWNINKIFNSLCREDQQYKEAFEKVLI